MTTLGHQSSDDPLDTFAARFVNRMRPYAMQQEDGTYRWRYEELTREIVMAHLRGELTLALSSSDESGRCRWLCLDIDDGDGLRQLLAVTKALAAYGLPGLVEASRRGGHLWLFLEAPTPVAAARTMLSATLDVVRAQEIVVPDGELYPDAGTAAHAGLGHAVRLPLGIHRLNGRRYALFDAYGLPCVFTSSEAAMRFVLACPTVAVPPLAYLRETLSHSVRGVSGSEVDPVDPADAAPMQTLEPGARDPTDARMAHSERRIGTRSPVIRWVDAHVSPLDLLTQLAPDTELKHVGRGYLGWCPFNDDRESDAQGRLSTPSFYVVQDRHYGWSWRRLSTNCEQHEGPMRHSFRLLQELTGLSVASAVVEALAWWPEADVPRRVVQG